MGNNSQKYLDIPAERIKNGLGEEIEVLKTHYGNAVYFLYSPQGVIEIERLRGFLGRNVPSVIAGQLVCCFGKLQTGMYYINFPVFFPHIFLGIH